MSEIILSVFGSTLTVSVALAALILTSSSHTRQQFSEQIDLVRRYSDSQFGQLREDLREVRGDVRELRSPVRQVRLYPCLSTAPPGERTIGQGDGSSMVASGRER